MAKRADSHKLPSEKSLERNICDSLGIEVGLRFNLNHLRTVIESRISNRNLQQDLVQRMVASTDNIRGVFGELLFWHLLSKHGIELEPSGIKPGAPDFKIKDRNTFLEVAKPFISDIDEYRQRMSDAKNSIERTHAVQQQEMTNIIKTKFNEQLKRWHSDALYSKSALYLCLDLSEFSPLDMSGHDLGGLDTVGRLLYGVGNAGFDISRKTGEVVGRFIEDTPEIFKHNGAPINVGFLSDKLLTRLAGVLTVDFLGKFKLYKNDFAVTEDETFNVGWVELISYPASS
ncbi:MAG: hypothetical protein IPO40_23620 [Fibrobacteres bacterium]|nr:hypothetical protein [Fibrobacterota bacterium]